MSDSTVILPRVGAQLCRPVLLLAMMGDDRRDTGNANGADMRLSLRWHSCGPAGRSTMA